MGTGGSTVQVIKTNDGIEIQTLDYNKPVGQRDFKTVKKATYKEIKEKIKDAFYLEKDIDKSIVKNISSKTFLQFLCPKYDYTRTILQ